MATQQPEVMPDVPANMVDQIMKEYKAAGAKTVTKKDNGDGTWTITATF
jgi:hypothetical protein